jgi:ABC-type lipoprotein release transport system permease subunit
VAGRHDLVPAGWIAAIDGIRGVGTVRGRLWGYYFDPVTGANYTVQVPERFWRERGEAVVGSGVARVRDVRAGERLALRDSTGGYLTLAVREVVPADVELVASDLILVGEEDFRALFGVPPGLYTDLAVGVRNVKEVDTVARKVTAALPAARPITRAELLRTWDAVFDWRSGLVVLVLTGALSAFAIVAWDRASGLPAEEQREIGILKAIGWETSDVLVVKLWEGAVISLSAFLLGTLAAYGHVFLGRGLLLAPVLRGWSTLQAPLRVVPAVDAQQLATLFLLTVVPYTVATLVPAWRAATVDPDRVMRGTA